MTNYLDSIELTLSQATDSGRIRHQVLSTIPWSPTPTTNVAYVSSNRVLIIANLELAQSIESRLGEKIQVYIGIPSDRSGVSLAGNAWNVWSITLAGYLGRFIAHLADPGQNSIQGGDDDTDTNLGKILGIQNGLFDHVIDCSAEPLIHAAVKPPGYYCVADDQEALDDAIEQIPQLIGEFEKPKFFEYNSDICAHSRSGIVGCNRCIDACPTDAIISIGEQIEVNTHLCQGGGSCTASCPSGAITYRYPKAEEQIEFLRQISRELRVATENHGITMLIYDSEHGAEILAQQDTPLPEHIIPLMVEEIGSTGLDLITSAMAYGANQLFIFAPGSAPDQVVESLQRDVNLVQVLLQNLNLANYQVELVRELTAVYDALPDSAGLIDVATYAGVGTKRSLIRSALQFFNEASPSPQDSLELPQGSIFGQLIFNHDACTLCMGCVSVCPASALEAGGETPALKFIEANCLQCGICTRACPESALALDPRFNFDSIDANKSKALKQEEPFRCIKCSKPFATHAMINRMTKKLKGHWMFEKPEALNRLRMCEDCRVADMFDKKDMIG